MPDIKRSDVQPTHVEEKVTERSIELTGDDSSAGTQAPQEKQGEDVAQQKTEDKKPDTSDEKSDDSDKSE